MVCAPGETITRFPTHREIKRTNAVFVTLHAYIRLMRLDKPIGIWLLYFPAGIAACMAERSEPDIHLLILLFLGALITRSAGCIINDLTDRKLDAQVERTRMRPLASGEITVPQAMVLLFLLGLAALLVVAFLPSVVIGLSLLALPMIVIYPWMKRLTWWPQLFLGITFNLAVLIGWAATGASFTEATAFLYGACIFWTLGYDTIYALQDMEDDRKVGIKSTALKFGKQVVRFVSGWYALMLLCLIFAGLMADTGPAYLLGVVLVALHVRWQVREVPFAKAERSAGQLFRSNQWLGLVLFAAIFVDRMLIAGAWQWAPPN